MTYILVAAGAALGGVTRYWLSGIAQNLTLSGFPIGTLVVNLIGSFIIGMVLFSSEAFDFPDPNYRIFLTTGFCGGLTTFSTFSYETFALIRESQYFFAVGNIALNVLLTIAAVVAARLIIKIVAGV